MSKANGPKRERKNMNLSSQMFKKLERIKGEKERSLGTTLTWDTFFNLLIDDMKKLREAATV
jgi:hypothetical protein